MALKERIDQIHADLNAQQDERLVAQIEELVLLARFPELAGVPPEHRAAVGRGLAQREGGEGKTKEEVLAQWKKKIWGHAG